MIADNWLDSSLIVSQSSVATMEALVGEVAGLMATAAGAEAATIEAAFLDAMRGGGFSVGEGVAIPHTEMESISDTLVCLVTLRQPLNLESIDGRPPDVFLFILAKPDPQAHLLLLAHLARLMQGRTFLSGLRRAQTPQEVLELVRAAEMRHRSLQNPGAPPVSSHSLFVISIGGEKAVDALLIELVDQGFGDASILEAQSLGEAAAREVPLFAGFRDLFGDPGGRRVLILQAPADRADALIATVRDISQEHRAKDARVSVIPMQSQWVMPAAPAHKPSKGH